jgi:diguanylate cyclase (GGDEF)-like protein
MTDDAHLAWQFYPALDAAALALAVLGVYVALDLARRLPGSSGRPALLWLLGSALALGTGMWCVHFITLAGNPLPFAIGYGGLLTAAGWLWGLLASSIGLRLAFGPRGTVRAHAVAMLVLTAGALGSYVVYLVDLRLAPAPDWRWLWLGATALVLPAALSAAGWLAGRAGPRAGAFRGAAALVAGLALVAAHRVTLWSAQVPFDSISLNHFGTASDGTMTALAAVGGSSLLAMLLLVSVLESRMRSALQTAVGRADEAIRFDPLTNLANRADFDPRLEVAAQLADRSAGKVMLLFIGLDGFKPVNDSFGRRVGDQLLKAMAERLQAMSAGSPGSLARVGGDEFALLLPGASKAQAATTAQRLLDQIAEPCDIEGRQTPMTASIGLVCYPDDGPSSSMLTRAEAAARYAKRNGGATFAFFEPRMLGDAREQIELLRDLRQAMARNQFELYFQPKIHAPSGEITGAEALLRWHHPERGMVSPAVFVPIAERFGLIGVLGQWVIDEACRQVRAWRDQGLRMRVAINLSVHQLRQPDLAERISKALEANQVNPQLLTCEITESAAMEDAEGTRKIFERLAAIGVHISIDDFGTGYSSLSYLRKLPAGELKIDRSFVLDLETSADARAVVDAVVKLAQALGLKVVAEGVETEAQNRILRSLGCDELQGYLFAKPMSAKALALWAMQDEGPRSMEFRQSLFQETLPTALH